MDFTSLSSLQALQASTQAGAERAPAPDPASISRFQELLGEPHSPTLAGEGPGAASQAIRSHSENMSSMWSSAQASIENLLKKEGDLSMKDVLQLQYDMVKTSAAFEVVSKAAGMTEKGTESLFQRN
ncbi:hypothetical protein GM658_18615 [Pseudoduganella eburnea]|uniref:EscI/YscI/HrpB family type III secretion system inner rod protein n=1 Tax=Massilia eburnea TaxID=1776165 RepID=A0A6L6QLP3_9BURK|nr:hypothetical protein [Massilia eburnea]MTW12626.1 hypothetical protein [Massilia eburnea]